MTNERAIAILEEFKVIDDWTAVYLPPMEDAVDKAIEALRSEVLCALADRKCPFQGKEFVWCLTCPHISEEDRELVKAVASEPKTGEWIEKSTGGEMFSCCSVCGYVEWDAPRHFCPNCGARMLGEDGE